MKHGRLNSGGKGILGGIILFLLVTNIAMATHTLTPDSPTVDVKEALIAVNLISKLNSDDTRPLWIQLISNISVTYDSLPLWLELSDSLGQPVEGLACTLSVGRKKLVRFSDDFGEVLFWVPPPKPFLRVLLVPVLQTRARALRRAKDCSH